MKVDFKNIKDINVSSMTKRKLNNKTAFFDMIDCDSKIISKINRCFNDGGFVYYFEYKKVIKAIYLFEVKGEFAKCNYEIISKDIAFEDKGYLNNAILEDLEQLIVNKKVNEIEFNGKIINPKKIKFDRYGMPLLIFSLIIGGILGYYINSFILGLLFGFGVGFLGCYSLKK